MINTELLESKIKESGLKKQFIAERLNLSQQGFYLKCIGKNDFTSSEIVAFCKLLGITDKTEIMKLFF